MRGLRLCLVGLFATAAWSAAAGAAEIAVLSAGAMRSVLQELAPQFEKASGHKLKLNFGTAGEVEQRIAERQSYDVAVATKPRIQTLEGAGSLVAGSVVMIGRAPIALAVKQGAAKPDIGTVEAFKQALLAAKSVGYTDPATGGTSGIHMISVFKRLGIAEQIQPKAKPVTGKPDAPPAVGEAVAHGEAEIGMQPVSELIGTPGIDIVGPIPAELQSPDLVYAAGVVVDSRKREAGAAFVAFLASPAAAAVVKSKGLIPGDAR